MPGRGPPGPRPAGRGPPGPPGPPGRRTAGTRTAITVAARSGRARSLRPGRRRRPHAGRRRAERVVAGPRAGTRSARTRTGTTRPGSTRAGTAGALRPRRGRTGTLTTLTTLDPLARLLGAAALASVLGASVLAAPFLAAGTLTARGAGRTGAGTRTGLTRPGGGCASWAAEVGRSSRRPRRPGHPRGAGSSRGGLRSLRPGVGRSSRIRPGGRRLRDRRQLAAGVGSRGGSAGAFGRRGPLGRAVGRPDGRRTGDGRGNCPASYRGHPVVTDRRGGRHDAIWPRAAARTGAVTRCGRPRSLRPLAWLFRLTGGECFLEPPNHGGLNRRGCRPYELAHFLELVHDGLALDTELFREFVNPDLRHYAPSRPSPLDHYRTLARAERAPGRPQPMVIIAACSSSAHQLLDLLSDRCSF